MTYDPSTADFYLTYSVDPAITAPTVIFVPVSRHYPGGYCTKVTGGGRRQQRGPRVWW